MEELMNAVFKRGWIRKRLIVLVVITVLTVAGFGAYCVWQRLFVSGSDRVDVREINPMKRIFEMIEGPDTGGKCRQERRQTMAVQLSLYSAAQAGDEQQIKTLVSRGGDVNKGEWDGRKPLHAAVTGGHVGAVCLLLDEGADPNANSWLGTPLHCAIQNDHLELVRLLLQRGANPNVVSHTIGERFAGAPPLVLAASRGQRAIVEVLLAHGGDPSIPSGTGNVLPIDAAKDETIKELLRGAASRLQQQKEAKAPMATHNEDGTFSDAVPEKLGEETDALTSLLSQLPALTDEQLRQLEGSAQRNNEVFVDLGSVGEAVEWVVAKTAEIARDVQGRLRQVTNIRVECHRSTWMKALLTIELYRTFSSVPPTFRWMAMHGPGTLTKPVIYIGRKSQDQYVARYMSGAQAALE